MQVMHPPIQARLLHSLVLRLVSQELIQEDMEVHHLVSPVRVLGSLVLTLVDMEEEEDMDHRVGMVHRVDRLLDIMEEDRISLLGWDSLGHSIMISSSMDMGIIREERRGSLVHLEVGEWMK